MRFLFHPAAENEFDLAVEYYETCQPGLGLEFAEEVYSTIARISQNQMSLILNMGELR
jgi:hypothetical protein